MNIIDSGIIIIKDGIKNAPAWLKCIVGGALVWAGYEITCELIDRKAEKDQETAKMKSDLRKEEVSQKSAQGMQESKVKTKDAMDLDDRKTDNKIRIIQAKGQEERENIKLKHNLSQTVSSVGDEIVVEPTFPVSNSIEVEMSKEEFLDGPFFKKGGVNILAGAPGVGKSSMLTNFLLNQSGTLQAGLFSYDNPDKWVTCYLYDYELGNGFFNRYHNLSFRNFNRCDIEAKAVQSGDVVYSLDYLYRQIQEDLEYPSGDVVMAIDCKGKIVDANKRANELINRLKRFINDYQTKNKGTLTFILVEHLNPKSASPSTILCESKIKGSQAFNAFADQSILVGRTFVDGCVRAKIAKNRYGKEQVYTVHLFQKVDDIYFNYIGEYDENHVLMPKDGSGTSLEDFRRNVKPTITPTYVVQKKGATAGRPVDLTEPICMAILKARSTGVSKNKASSLYGFTRQAYNEALRRYGLKDNYPVGYWNP